MKVSSEVRRGIQFLGAGVRGGCELPYVGSGNLEIKLMPSAMASKAFNSSAASPVQLATFYLKKKKSYESQLIHLDKQHLEYVFAAKAKP